MPKALRHSKSKKYFCGKSCQTLWRNKAYVGKLHPNWQTGEYTYRRIMLRSHIVLKCALCDLKDSRVLLVHHKDENRKNNNIRNLSWLCHNCHFLVHHYKEEKEKIMVAMV